MIYVCLYGIIGLVVSGAFLFACCTEAVKKYTNEKDQLHAFIGAAVISLFLVPVWPMVLTFAVIGKIKESKNSSR